MKIIYEQNEIAKKILGKQKFNAIKKYRKLFYVIEKRVEDGILLLNTLSYELILIENDELKLLDIMDNKTTNYLIENYFYVSEDFNDKKFAQNFVATVDLIKFAYKNVKLNTFVILPTTGCNARCYYCFEHSAIPKVMSKKTAIDVAQFIKRKGSGKVKLNWFGGEPLCNVEAINTITCLLRENNIEFVSKMVSNGYLFDLEKIKLAKEVWNLKKVQITLDGTENEYNRIKKYVNAPSISPFKVVINNIDNLLENNINVSIRLNMGEENIDDLFELAYYLISRYKNREFCSIYVAVLFDNDCNNYIPKKEVSRNYILTRASRLQQLIDSNMSKCKKEHLTKQVSMIRCMADNDSFTLISPEGKLGKCEHYVDSHFYGDIYSDEYDYEMLKNFKKTKSISEACIDCPMFFSCRHLELCNGSPKKCDYFEKENNFSMLEKKLEHIYVVYKESEKK